MIDRTKAAVIAVFVLLAGVAAWGWMRQPRNSDSDGSASRALAGQPAVYDTNGQYASARQSVERSTQPCATAAAYSPTQEPVYASRDYVRTIHPVSYAPAYGSSDFEERDRIIERPVQSQYVPQQGSVERVYRPHERSTKKSAVIVAGSAAGGAAVGAVAGGGKGAGIGALAGGAGGFIYDRLTHKH